MIRTNRAIFAAAALLLQAGCAAAATGPATPANLTAMLDQASGGQTIVLTPGDYGAVVFPKRAFSPALKIDAARARFSGIELLGVSGVEIDGGILVGPGGKSYGVRIDGSRDIRIAEMRIGGAHRGIVVARSQDIALVGNILDGVLGDGIDIGSVQRIRVERNICRNFTPTMATYDATGKRLTEGDHPDCIQAWSRPQNPPSADLTIIDNVADGMMQGVFLGNHVRDGVDDGGFDRVVVRGNKVTIAMGNGIRLDGVRGAEVTGNVVRTVPGARQLAHPDRPVRATMRLEGERIHACGNKVEAVPNAPGTNGC